MLFGLLLHISQQFCASVPNDAVEARLQFLREHKRKTGLENREKTRTRYMEVTNKLVELEALQQHLKENRIIKVSQLHVLYDSTKSEYNVHIEDTTSPISLDLWNKIQQILLEQEKEFDCCFSPYRPRYPQNCDLSVVFDRVKSELQIVRNPLERFLDNRQINQ